MGSVEMEKLLRQMVQDSKDLMLTQLPPARTPDIVTEKVQIPMPDGIRLEGTCFHPVGEGPWPVILMRNPYIHANLVYADLIGSVFARYGYAALVVFVRGTGGSEGQWDPVIHEIEDGRAVVDWTAKQQFCNGSIGTYGESYVGLTQWSIADYEHPALKTHFIGVMGTDSYELFYRRGMFRPEIWSCWSGQMMGSNRRTFLSPEDNAEILKAVMTVKPAEALGEALIGEHCEWLEEWTSNTRREDPLWTEGFFAAYCQMAQKLVRPVFIDGGWYDIFLRSQMASWRAMNDDIRSRSRFMISPRSHTGMYPGPDCDKAGLFSVRAALEWFDYMLLGAEYPYALGVIDTYCVGEGKWHELSGDFRKDREIKYYFRSEGVGQMQKLCGNTDLETGEISYCYDPENPVETRGGQVITNNRDPYAPEPECSVDQGPAGERADIISFISDPLQEDLCVTGSVGIDLYVSSSAPATAFTVKLIEELEGGPALNVRDDITDIRWVTEESYQEYVPGEIRHLQLSMCECSWMFKKGSRVRVDVSSSNFPAYHVHPNTTAAWAKTTESTKAQQTVYCGGRTPSGITLPVVNK